MGCAWHRPCMPLPSASSSLLSQWRAQQSPHQGPRRIAMPHCPARCTCVQHPFVGLLFMFGVMVLETTLYVIRTTVPPKLHMEAARRAQEARAAQAVAKLRRELEQQQEESSSKAVGKGMQQRHLEQQQGRDTKDASVLPKGRAEKKDN